MSHFRTHDPEPCPHPVPRTPPDLGRGQEDTSCRSAWWQTVTCLCSFPATPSPESSPATWSWDPGVDPCSCPSPPSSPSAWQVPGSSQQSSP